MDTELEKISRFLEKERLLDTYNKFHWINLKDLADSIIHLIEK